MGQPLTTEQRIAQLENLCHTQGVMINEMRQVVMDIVDDLGIDIPPPFDEARQ